MTPRLPRPHLVFLWREEIHVRQMFTGVYQLEGYEVEIARSANEALFLVDRSNGPCIVLMGYFVFNPEALRLITRLAGKPALRMRVKVVGADAISGGMGGQEAALYTLDAHFQLPVSIDEMISTMERLWARLQQESPSRN